MLKPENKIFKNLYNDLGWEIDQSIKEMIGRILKKLFQKVEIG